MRREEAEMRHRKARQGTSWQAWLFSSLCGVESMSPVPDQIQNQIQAKNRAKCQECQSPPLCLSAAAAPKSTRPLPHPHSTLHGSCLSFILSLVPFIAVNYYTYFQRKRHDRTCHHQARTETASGYVFKWKDCRMDFLPFLPSPCLLSLQPSCKCHVIMVMMEKSQREREKKR